MFKWEIVWCERVKKVGILLSPSAKLKHSIVMLWTMQTHSIIKCIIPSLTFPVQYHYDITLIRDFDMPVSWLTIGHFSPIFVFRWWEGKKLRILPYLMLLFEFTYCNYILQLTKVLFRAWNSVSFFLQQSIRVTQRLSSMQGNRNGDTFSHVVFHLYHKYEQQ